MTKLYSRVASAIAVSLICLFALGCNSTSDGSKGRGETTDPNAKEGKINGHEWVDLGLPSGLKWATCNLGASKPEDYGDYFAWGETAPKEFFDENTCQTYEMDDQWLLRKGYLGKDGNLTPEHDAARQNWGGSWRMPTKEEMEELINHTTSEWITRNGVDGLLVKSKTNGNSIFLPGGGYIQNTNCLYTDVNCRYWSSTPFEDYSYYAYILFVNYVDFETMKFNRFIGISIRPVSD